jgi:trehalose/maltose transport system substrate-binding protein
MRQPLKTPLLLLTLLPTALPAMAAEITVACGDGGAADFCPELSQRWAEANGHQVNIVTTPASATEKLSLYQQLLGSQSQDVDVLMVDIVWPGLLAEHLVDLNDYLPEGAAEGFIPSLMENNTVQGKLVALPWFTDAGLLY